MKDIEKIIKEALKGDKGEAIKVTVMNQLIGKSIDVAQEVYDEIIDGGKIEKRNFMINFAVNFYGNVIKKYSPEDKFKMGENFKQVQESLDKWIAKCLVNVEKEQADSKKRCGNPDCEAHD